MCIDCRELICKRCYKWHANHRLKSWGAVSDKVFSRAEAEFAALHQVQTVLAGLISLPTVSAGSSQEREISATTVEIGRTLEELSQIDLTPAMQMRHYFASRGGAAQAGLKAMIAETDQLGKSARDIDMLSLEMRIESAMKNVKLQLGAIAAKYKGIVCHSTSQGAEPMLYELFYRRLTLLQTLSPPYRSKTFEFKRDILRYSTRTSTLALGDFMYMVIPSTKQGCELCCLARAQNCKMLYRARMHAPKADPMLQAMGADAIYCVDGEVRIGKHFRGLGPTCERFAVRTQKWTVVPAKRDAHMRFYSVMGVGERWLCCFGQEVEPAQTAIVTEWLDSLDEESGWRLRMIHVGSKIGRELFWLGVQSSNRTILFSFEREHYAQSTGEDRVRVLGCEADFYSSAREEGDCAKKQLWRGGETKLGDSDIFNNAYSQKPAWRRGHYMFQRHRVATLHQMSVIEWDMLLKTAECMQVENK